MLASIVHIVNGDWASLVYDLTAMDVVPPRTNLRRVTMVIHQNAEYLFIYGYYKMEKNKGSYLILPPSQNIRDFGWMGHILVLQIWKGSL